MRLATQGVAAGTVGQMVAAVYAAHLMIHWNGPPAREISEDVGEA